MKTLILYALLPASVAFLVAGWHARSDWDAWQVRAGEQAESTLYADEGEGEVKVGLTRRYVEEPGRPASRAARHAPQARPAARPQARRQADDTVDARRSRGEGRPNLHQMLVRLADERRVAADEVTAREREERGRHLVLSARESAMRVLVHEVATLRARLARSRGTTGELAGRVARASALAARAESVVNHLRSGSMPRTAGEAELDGLLGELRVLADRLRVDVDRALAVR
jgi:hypothetical protein